MDEKPQRRRTASVRSFPSSTAIHDEDAEQASTPEARVGEGNPIPAGRVWLMLTIFVVVILVVIARMTYWATASPLTDSQPIDTTVRMRSRITDRNGLLLATDAFSWEVYAHPPLINKDEKKAAELTAEIANALGQPVETIRAGLAVTYALTTLAKDVSPAQAAAINGIKINGIGQRSLVWSEDLRIRAYPLGAMGGHLLGFANYALNGVYGVEASYNDWLLGQKELPAEQNSKQAQALPDAWRVYLPSPGRHDLILNMDAALQHLVEKHLVEAIATYGAEAGTIIVMDPRDGSILALANYPAYDPTRNQKGDEERSINSAVGSTYEPGSVFKLVTIAAALDAGQITPNSVYTDTGTLVVDGHPIRNAENKSYGKVTVRQALAKSINVVTARICLDMGSDIFYRYVRQFGFGRLTEVDLSPEAPGMVKEPGNTYWSRFDQATNSFGQALTTTPLQMISAVATIASGGTRLQPQVARALVMDGRVYPMKPKILGYPIKPETAKVLTEMMVYNVDSASYAGFVPGYRVAGKTGTAEIATAKGYSTQESITSFVGFLPAADPQLVILVKLDKPKRGRWAEQVAVPVFGTVAQDAVRVLRIAPDDREP